jgi:hypothetical protein
MKNKNRNTAEYQASGRMTAKADFRQYNFRQQKFFRWGWFSPISLTVETRSNQLPGKFLPMILNHPFARISRSRVSFCQRKDLLPEIAFYQGFYSVLAGAILCAHGTRQSKLSAKLVN